jgi:glycosyltransferase involved in cell wall biosynthesis
MKNNQSSRPKILLSCYACEPDCGSEPGVGWNWAMAMSEKFDVVVLTRSNNKSVIEQALLGKPAMSLLFIYYDLPSWVLKLKKKGVINASAYYLMWQMGVRKVMGQTIDEYAIVHHMTFNMFLCPGYWRPKKSKLILGPLGGGSCVPKAYLALFGNKAWVQKLRAGIVSHWRWMPYLKGSLDRASTILCANEDTYNLLNSAYPDKCKIHLETGIDPPSNVMIREPHKDAFEFIQIGGIEARKGWRLSLMAVAQLKAKSKVKPFKLRFVGSGPEYAKAKHLAQDLGVDDLVCFHGKKSLAETLEILEQSDTLLFPSVRDTSGNVVLEAMSRSIPVICLDHQGAKEMTSNKCAIQITPSEIKETVNAMAEAMNLFLDDDELGPSMGEQGKKRIEENFTWAAKRAFMENVYRKFIYNGEGASSITDH